MNSAITLKDITPLAFYRSSREEYVKRMIAYKKSRRVKLMENISLLFENRDTVLYQIQELAHSEDLTDPKELAEYIEIYSGMLPGHSELSATLFLEMDNQLKLEEFLVKLKGIEHHLSLQVGSESVQAVFEEVHDDREFTTSVHYLKFPLPKTAAHTLQQAASDDAIKVELVLAHPNLHAQVALSQDTIKSIAKDLSVVN